MERTPSSSSSASIVVGAIAATTTAPQAHSALDDRAALDTMTFDSLLSFLAEADAIPVKAVSSPISDVSSARRPPLLPECDDDDVSTSALLDEMLALEMADAAKNGAEEALWKTIVEPSSTSSSPPPTPPLPVLIPQPMHKITSSRTRQKEEIEYLRAQVAELESELARLKQPAGCGGGEIDSAAASVWANIAQRQSAEKQRVEIENVKLREMFEGQLRIARSLEKLLRKRLVSEADALFVERKRSRESPALDLEYAVDDIHARISHQLDEVEAVIRECGLATMTTDFNDVCATSDATIAICMELTMVKVFPFALADVAEAVWQLSSANRLTLPNGYYGATQRSDSVADLQFALNLRVRRSETTIHVRGVTTRRSTARHMILVFETVGATDGPLFSGQGISCRERGYALVEEGPASSVAPSTIVKFCVRLWPEADLVDSTSGGTQPNVGLFVDLVVGSYNQNVKTMLQVVENMLIGGQRAQGAR